MGAYGAARKTESSLFLAALRVDGTGPSPYIGGGPHLPNEVLSFWKE